MVKVLLIANVKKTEKPIMEILVELLEPKFIMRKNDKIKHLSQVICCEKHKLLLDQSWVQHEPYYGLEECVVCEVNK